MQVRLISRLAPAPPLWNCCLFFHRVRPATYAGAQPGMGEVIRQPRRGRLGPHTQPLKAVPQIKMSRLCYATKP